MQNCSTGTRLGRSLTNHEFIERTNLIHNNKYDYSQANYINNETKIIILCPNHGPFKQTPHHHLNGGGCKKCFIFKRHQRWLQERISNKNSFILKAVRVHGDKYDYSLVNYVNSKTKVKIICHIHGVFEQKPNSHLIGNNNSKNILGNGCPGCAGLIKFDNYKFIERAIKVHGDKYDYCFVNYINYSVKVDIVCKNHGIFKQTPRDHLRSGYGCKKCADAKKAIKNNEFIDRAIKIHGDKYDYSLVTYINSISKVKILCKKHGVFEQAPHTHLNGGGCKKCYVRFNEQLVGKILEKYKLEFKHNYSLRTSNRLFSVDYFVPKYNLLIEYNGAQHYRPVCFGNQTKNNAKKKFKKQKLRDAELRKHSSSVGMKLLEIDGRIYYGEKLIKFLNSFLKDFI